MTVNQIINTEVISGDSPPVIEPVGLSEMKDYLRLQGFTADEDSPADEFDFDDDLITDFIEEGRIWSEEYIGGPKKMHSIVPREIEVVLDNEAGMIELPGPSRSVPTIEDQNGNAITGGVFIGTTWPKLETCYHCRITLNYSAGYTTYPPWVKNAIKAYVAWRYEHRGDEEALKGFPEFAASILRLHRKINPFG